MQMGIYVGQSVFGINRIKILSEQLVPDRSWMLNPLDLFIAIHNWLSLPVFTLSKSVWNEPSCAVTEESLKHEISDSIRRGIAVSEYHYLYSKK